MKQQTISIRPFIGSKDYKVSRAFYSSLGFEETELSATMCVFKFEGVAFYLQNYYAKEWIENLMIFVEVTDVTTFYNIVQALDLPAKYPGVNLHPIRKEAWGREFFLLDPAGVLWHFGAFTPSS